MIRPEVAPQLIYLKGSAMPQATRPVPLEVTVPVDYVRLEGSQRRPAASAKFLGPAKSKQRFNVTIVLRRRTNGPPLPGFEEYSIMSPRKHERLEPEEFAALYGADPDDIALVEDFAKAQGLTVVESHAGRRSVEVSGTAEQLGKAFAVALGRYRYRPAQRPAPKGKTTTYRGRDGFVHVPQNLAEVVVGVFGLDNRNITRRAAADPPNTVPLTVQQVTQFYNFPTNSAAGQTIAILSTGGYDLGDLQNFFGAAMPQVIPIEIDKGNTGADLETTQDICIAGAAAPGAAIAVYFTTHSSSGWLKLLQSVIHPDQAKGDLVCQVLSSSYYVSNGDDNPTLDAEGISEDWVIEVSKLLQDAAVQHVTVCAVTGDYGVDTTSYQNGVSDGKPHVAYPGSDPGVLSCGGTTIGNIRGQAFDEYVWNDATGVTGGGVSDRFNLPDYQQNANIPPSLIDGQRRRGVPDVAGNASSNSGYAITVNGTPTVTNGTSAVAPLYAGLVAILNAALGTNVGFLNTMLYELHGTVCRDVNPLSVNPPAGPVDNGLNGVQGYPAGPGWDACTGLGSINGKALLAALQAAIAPAPPAPVAGQPANPPGQP